MASVERRSWRRPRRCSRRRASGHPSRRSATPAASCPGASITTSSRRTRSSSSSSSAIATSSIRWRRTRSTRCTSLGRPAVEERVTQLGEAIASCAVRNRAALLLTLYEPPTTASDVLVELAQQAPTAITAAMTDVLEAGHTTGEVRDGIDLPILGERICQSMLHIGVGVFHRRQASHHLPTMKCRVFLHGIAKRAPADTTLDRSPAMRAAQQVIADLEHGGGRRPVRASEVGRSGRVRPARLRGDDHARRRQGGRV